MGEERITDQSSTPSASSLRQAIQSISLLISLSYSTKSFSAKWQLIRKKLEELSSELLYVENNSSFDSKLPDSGLIPEIMAILCESSVLAKRCADMSFSGKLLMQSDLDIILTKLCNYVKKVSGFCRAAYIDSGQARAIVVCKPKAGACKDDVRFYVRDLLHRLKIGDTDVKKQALVSLTEAVSSEDINYVKIVLECADTVNLLISLIDSSEVEIQPEAVSFFQSVSGFDMYKKILVTSGIIGPLVRVLEFGRSRAKAGSATCLMRLTENSENSWSVSSHGGVSALLKVCARNGSKAELIVPCCGVLRNLIGITEIRRYVIEEGAVPIFIRLARSKEDEVERNAIELIQEMASLDHLFRQVFILEAGGIPTLVNALSPRSSSSSSPKTQETTLRVIEILMSHSNENCIIILRTPGFMEVLLHLLRNGKPSVKELALKVSCSMSQTSEDVKKILGDAGFMHEFVKLLGAKSSIVRGIAAEALSGMVSVQRNRKRFMEEDIGMDNIIQFLDTEGVNSCTRKFLMSTLMSLTSCSSGRKKIVSCGYLKNIEKLAEAEVFSDDARKLVRKLSTNRVKSLFSGIWHS